jgi:ribosomal protein S18 acetylase RimI-like enzyme
MNLTKGNTEDNVTPLILSAAKSVFTSFDIGEETDICNYLYKQDNNKFSYQNTLVLKDQNNIIGIVIIYDANSEKSLAKTQEDLLFKKYNKKVIVENNESIPDTFYIDTLAVNPNYRNQQYGTKILTTLQQEYKTLSLLVDNRNEKALSLYQKLDFKIISTHQMFGGTYHKMLYQNIQTK